MQINKRITRNMSLTAIAAATSLLAACGGGGGSNDDVAGQDSSSMTIQGVVAGSAFQPGSATDPTLLSAHYQNASVCVDANANGKCDASENPVKTDSHGAFSLRVAAASALIADLGPATINTAVGHSVFKRNVFRVSLDQVKEQGNAVVISPFSAEVARMMEANNSTYAVEKQNLATRIGVPVASILTDVNTVTGTVQTAMLNESHALGERYAYATAKLDRGDLYPDALAVPGGDPRLKGLAGVTQATATVDDTRKPITFAQSQQAAFNIEGVPRYDHIFIVMLENKGTNRILNSPFAPNINHYLTTGNQLISYYATGNPSEPNYTALGGADDFGIADDSQWNCDATGANAVQDTPEPTAANFPTTLAKSPFTSPCAQSSGVNHNIVGKRNLFNAATNAGLTWRTYSESMNPGQDFRTDSVADAAVVATDNVYPNGVGGDPTPVGSPTLNLPLPGGLYKTKHHPGMAYQNVRSAPEWKYSNRTLGGGQWDAVLKNSTDYKIPANYDYDQFGTDLQTGNVGSINFVVPDQCDDMHGIGVSGTDSVTGTAGTASDCGGNSIITRGDNYVDKVVKKIQASPIWLNRQKKVAIVLMFDEGSGSGAFVSCCGWNVANSTVAKPLKDNGDGTWSVDTSINNYAKGNHGHGESIFGILNNQPDAPKGVVDSDAYSHFSFVRTLQDMFGLADPAIDASYMNRSKYTEKFIADNILNLPEYAGSQDTHFDSVRPINHAFVIPATYTQKQSSDTLGFIPPQVGSDLSQKNVWATTK